MQGLWLVILYILIAGVAYWFVLYPFHRRFHRDQIVWWRPMKAHPWYLVQITKTRDDLGLKFVHEGRAIHRMSDDPMWDDFVFNQVGQDTIVCSQDMRPIRWWQRNTTDPIIAKHFLLNGLY